MIHAQVDISAEGLERWLENAVAVLGEPERFGKPMADVLRASAARQFQAAGIPPWRPLSPRTIAQKRREGYPRLNRLGEVPQQLTQNGHFGPENILMRTGAGMSSWTDSTDPHHVEEITKEKVSIGTALYYMRFHQEGRGVPKRPIRVLPEDAAQAATILKESLTQGDK